MSLKRLSRSKAAQRVARGVLLMFVWNVALSDVAGAAGEALGEHLRKSAGTCRKLTAAEMEAITGAQGGGPAAPSNLTATTGLVNQIKLAWTSNGGFSFNVKRSTTTGGPYTQIANVTVTNYTDTGVTAWQRYYYVVTAVGMFQQESGPSNEANGYANDNAKAGFPERWQQGQSNGAYAQVNLVDGNQIIAVPLVGYAGRKLSVDFAVIHNSTDVGLTGWPNPLNTGWTHTYNVTLNVAGNGNVTVREGDGRRHTFLKNADNSYTPQAGVYDSLVKNVDTTYTLTRKNQVKLNFDANNRLGTVVESNGNTVTLTYNGGGLLTTVADPTGRNVTLAYNGSNQIVSVTDPASRTWNLIYDGNNRLWKVQDPLTYTVIFAYDASARISSVTDKRGNAYGFTYDTSNRVTGVTNPLNGTRSYGYGTTCPMGVCNSVTDERGNSQNWLYDDYGNHKGWCAMGLSDTRVYDGNHNMTSYTDRNNNVRQWTFDSRGNVLTAKDPLNNTTTNTYDSKNNLLTTTNPLNNTWTNTFDANNNLLTETDPLNKQVSHQYNANGLRTQTTDENGKITTFAYDSNGNLSSATDPNSNTVSLTYDSVSRKTSQTLPDPQPNGATTSFTYDALNRVTQITNPDTTTQTHTFDANSNMLTCVDENNKTTTHTFDALNRETQVTDALNRTVQFGYDAASNKTSMTDPRNTTYNYYYDSINRLTENRYPKQGMPGFSNETFTFDGNGNVTARKNRNGATINQVYDVVNRLTTIDYPTGTDTTFTYDAASRKTGMTDSTGSWTYSYNARNEVTSVASPTGKTVSYTYDNVEGRRLSMALSTYGTWSYLYDNGGRLTSVTNPNTETTSYAYNRNNQITQVTNGNTTTANYSYNSRLFLTSLTNKYSNQTVLSSYTYTLDNVGNRTRMTEANGDYTDYTYDAAYQLTRDWKRNNLNNSIYDYSYTFDGSGNRLTMVDNMTQTTTNYTYDSLNRMTAAGNITYAFDDNGNTLSKTVNAQTTSYTYNYENWLTQITYPNQSTNSFSYDGGGIRFSKTDSAGTTKYVRDGDSLIAELDGTNAMIAAYTNGPNGMVSQRRNNATKFHHFDGLGSTRQVTDSTQTVTDTYSFDAYGNITNQGGSSVNPAKYVGSQGYYVDGDSGLMLLGHRYYDPTTGRFITLDPIKDGVNWYGYCGNNPANRVDPNGLEEMNDCEKAVTVFGSVVIAICAVPVIAGTAPVWVTWACVGIVLGGGVINSWPPHNWNFDYQDMELPPTTPQAMCQQYCNVNGMGGPNCCAGGSWSGDPGHPKWVPNSSYCCGWYGYNPHPPI